MFWICVFFILPFSLSDPPTKFWIIWKWVSRVVRVVMFVLGTNDDVGFGAWADIAVWGEYTFLFHVTKGEKPWSL